MTSMHAGEVETDEALVGRLLAAQFPRWAGLSVERVSSEGTVNAIYRVGTDLSGRFPRIAWGARESRELESHHQWLLDLAPRLPVAIPEPLGIGRPAEGYPFTWEGHRWVEGEIPRIDDVAYSQELAADLADVVTALREISLCEHVLSRCVDGCFAWLIRGDEV